MFLNVPKEIQKHACLHNHHLLAKQKHIFLRITDTSATSALSHSFPTNRPPFSLDPNGWWLMLGAPLCEWRFSEWKIIKIFHFFSELDFINKYKLVFGKWYLHAWWCSLPCLWFFLVRWCWWRCWCWRWNWFVGDADDDDAGNSPWLWIFWYGNCRNGNCRERSNELDIALYLSLSCFIQKTGMMRGFVKILLLLTFVHHIQIGSWYHSVYRTFDFPVK